MSITIHWHAKRFGHKIRVERAYHTGRQEEFGAEKEHDAWDSDHFTKHSSLEVHPSFSAFIFNIIYLTLSLA